MATLALIISLVALLLSTSALPPPSSRIEQPAEETVWSAVSYIYHGEKTPLRGLVASKESLTPFGAHQMFDQGQAFRTRYLTNDNLTENDDELARHATIRGLSSEALDNTKLSVIAGSDVYVSTSALAFMQGLYPPTQAFADGGGGIRAARLENGTVVNWPLGGYQYPDVNVLSVLDPNSVWVEGHTSCTNYLDSGLHFTDDPNVAELYGQTLDFYGTMYDKIFSDAFPENMATFSYAHDLYEYAAYQYNHDNDTRSKMTSADLAMLAELAGMQQRELNGNLTVSGDVNGDMIRAVAGRMLAGKILERMKTNIGGEGATNKLNLIFGSYEPFVAFFALSGLVKGPSARAFETLPSPGAAMTFELFSYANKDETKGEYPAKKDLWVRFLYRNSSLPGTPFIPYPLFGNGNSQTSMLYNDFANAMQSVAVDGLAGWCNLCGSINLFCSALKSNSGGGKVDPILVGVPGSSKEMHPVVAGVVGAGVTLAVAGMLVLGSMIFGGVRYHVEDRRKGANGGGGGGFKGARKMASDDDLSYGQGGVRHERTSSWELRNNGATVQQTKDGHAVSTVSAKDASDGDGISIMQHAPVEARETL